MLYSSHQHNRRKVKLCHTHFEYLFNILLLEGFETWQDFAAACLARHCGEVGAIDAHGGEGAVQLQRIKQEV